MKDSDEQQVHCEPALEPAHGVTESEETVFIRRAQAGCSQSFALLVTRYQNRVYASIIRQGIPEASAADCTQEILFKSFRAIQNFRFESSFKTWLLCIATNHCRNHFHSRQFREARITDELVGDADLVATTIDGYDAQALRQIQLLVQELPEPLREVMVLIAFEQCSYEEVSQVLGIPVGTVRSRLHRGRQILRERYFRNGESS